MHTHTTDTPTKPDNDKNVEIISTIQLTVLEDILETKAYESTRAKLYQHKTWFIVVLL